MNSWKKCEKPFEPLHLLLSDGTKYEIRHPDLIMVGRSKILIGTPAAGHESVFERYDVVNLLHVVRMEPIEPPAKPAAN